MRTFISILLLSVMISSCSKEADYTIIKQEPTELGKNQILVWAVVSDKVSSDQLEQCVNELYSEAEEYKFSNGEPAKLIGVYLYRSEEDYKKEKSGFVIMKYKDPLNPSPTITKGL